MNIRPTNSPTPRYPALATLAVAAALALPSCEEPLPPQPTAGAPLPPPQQLDTKQAPAKTAPEAGKQAGAPKSTGKPVRQERQLILGKMKRPDFRHEHQAR